MCLSAASVLTSHVLIHHIWSVFHKEAEHGGATRAALQPQQDRSFIFVSLSHIRSSHRRSKISAPPSGKVSLTVLQ